MPIPLSSQTNSSGIGTPWYAECSAVLIAPTAVEWFADASPKLHTVTASSGHAQVTPSLRGAGDGERDPEGARQMRGDGRRLRNDVQVMAAEHLVPAA